ncbi:hypothetical protein Poly30_05190 [Planctomycetes bacterium Poly30]|uniref:Uncharacterized protein n=1 Tax=Saltatorellus ferox TaxID=2528018 RepID=A0A518ELP9_9BACT|nr:hypothetical protein Poly30_05190 [Planctomycetes bacterium Poly30]
MSNQANERIEVSPIALAQAWRAVGHRIAVIAGSATAFLSLLQHTPVHVASFRGALVWTAVLTTTSLGAWLAQKTWNAPPPDPTPEDS